MMPRLCHDNASRCVAENAHHLHTEFDNYFRYVPYFSRKSSQVEQADVVVVELPQAPEDDLRSARAASGRRTR